MIELHGRELTIVVAILQGKEQRMSGPKSQGSITVNEFYLRIKFSVEVGQAVYLQRGRGDPTKALIQPDSVMGSENSSANARQKGAVL